MFDHYTAKVDPLENVHNLNGIDIHSLMRLPKLYS